MSDPGVDVTVGGYTLFDELHRDSLTVTHLAREEDIAGAPLVTARMLKPAFAQDAELAAGLVDEARTACRIRSRGFLPVTNLRLTPSGRALLVSPHVPGLHLAALGEEVSGVPFVPVEVVVALLIGVLDGLRALHELCDADGEPLGWVHGNFGPESVFVSADGRGLLMDVGLLRVHERPDSRSHSRVRGDYLAPEQIVGAAVDRRADVFAVALLAWELLTGRPLFTLQRGVVVRGLRQSVEAPSRYAQGVSRALDAVILAGLERDPLCRVASAREFAAALASAVRPATPEQVAAWVARRARGKLQQTARRVAELSGQEPHNVVSMLASLWKRTAG
jgi:serine/threonine-protein kinase